MPGEPVTASVSEQPFRVGDWLVEPAFDRLTRGSEVHKIEPRTMRVLLHLAATPGKTVSLQELLDNVWSGVVVGPASVYQAVSQLRKLLGCSESEPRYIVNIPRRGYRLIAPLSRDGVSAANPTSSAAGQGTPAKALRWRWMALAGSLVLVATLAIMLVRRTTELPSAGGLTMAVFPFTASGDNEVSRALAPVITDVVRLRLASLRDLSMIAANSTEYALRNEGNALSAARKLQVRYALRGDVARTGEEVRIDATLVEIPSGVTVWQRTFQRPAVALEVINDEIARDTAKSLQMTPDFVGHNSPGSSIDLEAYGLYLRGRTLLTTYRAGDAEEAVDVFTRVTTLDPNFARGYLSLGQALLLSADLGARPLTTELKADAGKAFDRALELDPGLGEALAQRARLTSDPAEADAMYRRAIELAPGFDESYVRYSDFLFTQRRRGEALDLIDRARRIDPSSATLCVLRSQLLISTRADIDGQQRELRQALIINPGYPTALRELARSNWILRGDFAEAIQLVERSLAIDRASDRGDWIAVGLYVEVGEPEAAKDVLRNTRRPDDPGTLWPRIWIAMSEHDTARSSRLAHELVDAALNSKPSADAVRDDKRTYSLSHELYGWYDVTANALRDEALASGDYSYALDRLGQTYDWRAGTSAIRARGLGLTYAHVLMLAGETQRARDLLTAMLRAMDAEQTGRPKGWFAWERASAYAMLGDDERALAELTSSLAMNHYTGWWYTIERDPIFDRIRPDPRFQALATQARNHLDKQRALLEKMRLEGKVPRRG